MKKSLFIIAGILLLISCQSNDPEFINDPNYKTDRYGSFKVDTLYAVKDSTVWADTVNTNNTLRLSMTNMGGVKAGFVIKYLDVPADTINVSSAKIRFTTLAHFGQAGDEALVDMYSTTKLWDALDDINGDKIWHENPPISFLKTVNFTLKDSGITEIDIDPEWVKTWQGNDSLNYGFYFTLNPAETNLNVELGSKQSSFPPQIVYAYNDTSDTVQATNDATIFDYDRENGRVFSASGGYISAGIPTRYLVRFDMSALKENAIYYYANLAIPFEQDFPYRNSNKSDAFTFTSFEDYANNDKNPGYSLSMNTAAGKTRITNPPTMATDFIQPTRNGDINHQWFSVQYTVESDVFTAMHIYGADSDKKPMLIVKYLEK